MSIENEQFNEVESIEDQIRNFFNTDGRRRSIARQLFFERPKDESDQLLFLMRITSLAKLNQLACQHDPNQFPDFSYSLGLWQTEPYLEARFINNNRKNMIQYDEIGEYYPILITTNQSIIEREDVKEVLPGGTRAIEGDHEVVIRAPISAIRENSLIVDSAESFKKLMTFILNHENAHLNDLRQMYFHDYQELWSSIDKSRKTSEYPHPIIYRGEQVDSQKSPIDRLFEAIDNHKI